mmetsp:Transcript_16488/g.42308  ORF Transcript_16488/g.42308 Transcript_16488/m.42308 type:complete len:256 (+) Transcript_16488:432-1199(+)
MRSSISYSDTMASYMASRSGCSHSQSGVDMMESSKLNSRMRRRRCIVRAPDSTPVIPGGRKRMKMDGCPWRMMRFTELRMRSISSSRRSSRMWRCRACENESWSSVRARVSQDSSIKISSRSNSDRAPICHFITVRGKARRSSCCCRLSGLLPLRAACKSLSSASSKLGSAPHHTLMHAALPGPSLSAGAVKKKTDAGAEPCGASVPEAGALKWITSSMLSASLKAVATDAAEFSPNACTDPAPNRARNALDSSN